VASPWVVSRPMPLVAPVMRAVRPTRLLLTRRAALPSLLETPLDASIELIRSCAF